MTDPDYIHLSTRASLVIIGCAGLALGLFIYFGKVAFNEAVGFMFGPG